jgi:ribosomal protein L29
MKYKELKNLPEKELQKILGESKDRLREMKFKVAADQLKNLREIRLVKKTIARILFLLKQNKKKS